MNKTTFNFMIDALLLLFMAAITGIGFLMKFVLLPGRESHIRYGKNVTLFFWGMDRHEWGTIHLTLGFILLGLLILHIVFHWNIIVNIYTRIIGARKIRIVLAVVLILAVIILGSFPLMVNPEVQERGRGGGGYGRGKGYFERGHGPAEYYPYNYEE